MKITAYDCPRIPASFLAEERRVLPASWFASEYLGEFTDASYSVFTDESIALMTSGDPDPWFTADLRPLFPEGVPHAAGPAAPHVPEYARGGGLWQRVDYSALVILERLAAEAGGMYQPGRIWPPTRPWTPATYVCHQLHRWPLGTPYPAVVQDVQAVLASGRLPPPVTCLVDGSGPGIAVLDLFGMGVTRPAPIGIVVTNGYETTRKRPNEWHTPKSSLVVHLQAAAEARPPRLILGPRLPFFEAVKTEMESFSAETNPATGYTRYEAERQQAHDDLLFVLGLCIWWGERFGDSNWSTNVDISRALDGGLVRQKRVPGRQSRVWAEDLPAEAPLDLLSWDQLKTRVGDGTLRPGGPYRPERG